MKKLNLTIVIPTRNRLQLLKKTLIHLNKNKFFFKEIIIVDSSDKSEKKKLLNLKNFLNIKIKILNCSAGISKQRNKGLKNVKKNSKYVMFLDDDVAFEKKLNS
jgi:Predicted glycosyltransferases